MNQTVSWLGLWYWKLEFCVTRKYHLSNLQNALCTILWLHRYLVLVLAFVLTNSVLGCMNRAPENSNREQPRLLTRSASSGRLGSMFASKLVFGRGQVISRQGSEANIASLLPQFRLRHGQVQYLDFAKSFQNFAIDLHGQGLTCTPHLHTGLHDSDFPS